jgi:hypothetical protein
VPRAGQARRSQPASEPRRCQPRHSESACGPVTARSTGRPRQREAPLSQPADPCAGPRNSVTLAALRLMQYVFGPGNSDLLAQIRLGARVDRARLRRHARAHRGRSQRGRAPPDHRAPARALVRALPLRRVARSARLPTSSRSSAAARGCAASSAWRPTALIGIGVDRLDYTNGVEERLEAVDKLLEREPALRGKFTFVSWPPGAAPRSIAIAP